MIKKIAQWIIGVGIVLFLGLFAWSYLFDGKPAEKLKTAPADIGEAETEMPGTTRHEVSSAKDVDPRIRAVVLQNLPDVGNSKPEVSRLALARIANTGRDGAIVLAYMLQSGDSTIRKNAKRALLLLRRGGHDIVRILSGMCTDSMLPANVSVMAMEIITGPDETDEKVGVLWEERESHTANPDSYEPLARRAPSPARIASPARTLASAVELQKQKNVVADVERERTQLDDKIVWLKNQIRGAEYDKVVWQEIVDNRGGSPSERMTWRDNLSSREDRLLNLKGQLATAQANLAGLR